MTTSRHVPHGEPSDTPKPAQAAEATGAAMQSGSVEMTLRALRELTGWTQVEAARGAGMTQSDVSFLERREDHRVSTLARYIMGLGGELVVLAQFGDRSIRIGPIRTTRKTPSRRRRSAAEP